MTGDRSVRGTARWVLALFALSILLVIRPAWSAEPASATHGCLPHPRGTPEASELGFGGGRPAAGGRVAASPDGSRRVGRTWKHGAKTVTQGFLYDDQLHVAAELDGSGNVVSTFVYGMRANVPDAMVRGGKTYRILSDWRGSVRAVVDASSGAVQESLDYDAWGNATDSGVTCASGAVCAPFQPFGFAGALRPPDRAHPLRGPGLRPERGEVDAEGP